MPSSTAERDQALLNALAVQAIRVPAPMIFVAFVISGLAYDKASNLLIVLWAFMAIAMQFIRYIKVKPLATDTSKSTTDRLKIASNLSLLNGLILASSIGFFPYMDETSRAVYSMIMIGIVAGTIATSHGYRPVFVGLVLPILSSVAFAWLITAAETLSFLQTMAISVLTAAMGAVLYMSSRDVWKSFGESFEAKKALEIALESEKSANAAKTRFLAAASHDLRQPLHAMSMFSAALTMGNLDEQNHSIATKMNSAMADLSSELDSLLDISKLDAGVMRVQPSDFKIESSLIRMCENFTEIANDKNLTLSLNVTGTNPVNIDRALFERVIRNLLDNAIKYTHEGTISVTVERKNNHCEIQITDSGIGIPENEKIKIKEEFYQLNNPERDRHKGLGLGLSIVWRILPLINAELTMDSEVGIGTSYSLTVPVQVIKSSDTSTQPTHTGKISVQQMSSLRGKSVLLVEDDQIVRNATRTLLESYELIVHEAVNTNSAMKTLQNVNISIDIGLLDLRLPNGDSGFNTINNIRRLKPTMPIIILSGETTPSILLGVAEAKCKFVVKPVNAPDLIDAIQHSLNEHEKTIDVQTSAH